MLQSVSVIDTIYETVISPTDEQLQNKKSKISLDANETKYGFYKSIRLSRSYQHDEIKIFP